MRRHPLRIAVVTSLYPNSQQPRHGIFVEQRLRQLVATGDVEARVVAPVPWFWSTDPRYGRYATLAAVPAFEQRHGIAISHPRYLVLPKVGMTLGPASLARGARSALKSLRADGFDFDVIDAHYFYPDGVAAARLSKVFDRPFVVTARGADLNTIADHAIPGRQIKAAAMEASGLITVSESLKQKLTRLGVAGQRIQVLRNGVDLGVFKPVDRAQARARLDVAGDVWLCVGHMIERKGMHFVIEALQRAPGVTLIIAGDGPEATNLHARAEQLGVADRIRFVGAVAHDELQTYYGCADALVLPTRSEGMPNVVLEALACGTAVIATAVDGIPEIMTGPPAGRLLSERSAEAIVSTWNTIEASELTQAGRDARRQYAEGFGWEATTRGQLEMFHRIVGARPTASESRRTDTTTE